MAEENPFENVEKTVAKLAKEMGLSREEQKRLLSFERIGKAELRICGKAFPAWRVVHNNALGPGKGGIRFHPNASESEVKALAFWMSIKNSLAGLPYGGAKGGVCFNPKECSRKEIEEISRAYIKAFHHHLGENRDVPAPDVYTNSQTMGWMLDEFEKLAGKKEPGMITGKPIALGGCLIRESATAKGGFIVFKDLMQRWKLKPSKTSIAIQGFGNAGSFIAQMLQKDGFKVIAVSDSKGGIIDRSGLDIARVIKAKKERGAVKNMEGAKKITNEELLELDADVLALAALENVVTKENAERVRAMHIVELANGPVTPEANEILCKKCVTIIPDVLANSGGVIGSYFEWVQNKVGNFFETAVLEKRLQEMMTKTVERVVLLASEKKIDMRSAAYIIAIQRILEAERARGRL